MVSLFSIEIGKLLIRDQAREPFIAPTGVKYLVREIQLNVPKEGSKTLISYDTNECFLLHLDFSLTIFSLIQSPSMHLQMSSMWKTL